LEGGRKRFHRYWNWYIFICVFIGVCWHLRRSFLWTLATRDALCVVFENFAAPVSGRTVGHSSWPTKGKKLPRTYSPAAKMRTKISLIKRNPNIITGFSIMRHPRAQASRITPIGSVHLIGSTAAQELIAAVWKWVWTLSRNESPLLQILSWYFPPPTRVELRSCFALFIFNHRVLNLLLAL
jgi:hypothetical protein